MSTSRRRFLAESAASVAALGATTAMAGDADSENADAGNTDFLDYGRSFICNTAAFNAVRFWVESRTTVIDAANDRSIDFYQCGSCKSENTFSEKDLLYADNYDFLPIVGDGDYLVFRRPARLSDRYREVRTVEEFWGEPLMKLQKPASVSQLSTWEEIRDVTADAVPIVSRTEISNEETGLRAIIECPVKTMNISLERQMYQVDTGPIAFPDLTKRYERPIECLSLAFVVFNAPHFADFVIEQPTPVVENDEEVCKIYHFSSPFSMPAKNILYAAGTAS